MSKTRTLPKNQTWFLDVAKVMVGEKFYDKKGMCYGYAHLCNQAIIDRDLKSFNERLQWIRFGPPKIADTAKPIRPKQIAKLAAAAKQYLQQLATDAALIKKKTGNLPDNTFENVFKDHEEDAIKWIYSGTPDKYDVITPEQLRSLIQIAQGIRAHEAKKLKGDIEAKKKLALFDKENPNIKSLIDIDIFFDDMALYQHPNLFSNIIGTPIKPTYQQSKEVLSLLAPTELDVPGSKQVKSRMIEIANYDGIYPLDKLQLYFEGLYDLIIKNAPSIKTELETEQTLAELPFTLSMGSFTHQVSVAFNIATNKWIVIDANGAPPYEVDMKDIAKVLAQCLTFKTLASPIVAFDTQININSEAKSILNIIDTWQQSDTFKDIHKIQPFAASQPEIVDDVCGASRLLIAARSGHFEQVKQLLEAGADPDSAMTAPFPGTDKIYTPFSVAEAYQFSNIVDLMWPYRLRKLETKINQLLSPAIDAVQTNVLDEIKKINLDIKLTREEKYQAMSKLHEVVITTNKLLTLVQNLPVDHPNRLAIEQFVAKSYIDKNTELFFVAIASGNLTLVETFLKTGIDPDQLNQSGFAAIHLAAQKENIPLMELLLKYNAHIVQPTNDNNTIFMIAAEQGNTAIFEKFLPKESSNINFIRKSDKKNALFLAAEHGHIDIVKLLLDKDASLGMLPDLKETPADAARRMNHPLVVELLTKTAAIREHRADIMNEIRAIAHYAHRFKDKASPRNIAVANLKELVDSKHINPDEIMYRYITYKHIDAIADCTLDFMSIEYPDAQGKHWQDAIKAAVAKAYSDILTVTDKTSGLKCLQNLSMAIQQINEEVISYHGELSTLTKELPTVLAIISKEAFEQFEKDLYKDIAEGHKEFVKIACELGANLKSAHLVRQKPGLCTAAEEGDTDTLTQLLKAGADPYAVDSSGETSLSIARRLNKTTILHAINSFLFEKNKELIAKFPDSDSPIRQKALVTVKQLVEQAEDEDFEEPTPDTFNIIFKTYQQLDGYAAKLLTDSKSAETLLGNAFKTAFADMVQIKDDAGAKECLKPFFKTLTAIRKELVKAQKTQPGLFKSAEQLKLIDDILKDAPPTLKLKHAKH